MMVLIIILFGTAIVGPVNTSVATITTAAYGASAATLFGFMTVLVAIVIFYSVIQQMGIV